jgi:hypothetical protein
LVSIWYPGDPPRDAESLGRSLYLWGAVFPALTIGASDFKSFIGDHDFTDNCVKDTIKDLLACTTTVKWLHKDRPEFVNGYLTRTYWSKQVSDYIHDGGISFEKSEPKCILEARAYVNTTGPFIKMKALMSTCLGTREGIGEF